MGAATAPRPGGPAWGFFVNPPTDAPPSGMKERHTGKEIPFYMHGATSRKDGSLV